MADTINITIKETVNNVTVTSNNTDEVVKIVISDVGVKGNDGLGAAESVLITNRITTLETNVGDTDFDFKTQIDNLLSF